MKRIALGVLVMGCMAATAPALAQESAAKAGKAATSSLKASFAPAAAQAAPEPKKVTVVVGSDFPSLYVFRGIVQEYDASFTMQPFVDIGVAVAPNVTLNFGSWNSFNTGSNSEAPAYDGAYYESDLYGSVTFVSGKWKPGLLYTLYTSPNGGYKGVGPNGSIGVSELAGFVSFDDSASKVPMSPKFVIAFELTDTQADFGTKKGIYFEAGIKPTFKKGTVAFGVPLKVGMSLKDYYQNSATGEDSTFGYFDIGLNASVPLSGMKKGSWEVHGGIDFYCFSETRAVQTAGQSEPSKFRPVGNIGFSVTF